MWFQRGPSYRLILVLFLSAAYCQLVPVYFTAPGGGSILTKGDPFNIEWSMTNQESIIWLQLDLWRKVGSDLTQISIIHYDGYILGESLGEGQFNYLNFSYTWTPSFSLESGNDYRITATDTLRPVTITSEAFTLQDPSSDFGSSMSDLTLSMSLVAPSTLQTSSRSIAASPTSSPTVTASTSPEPSSAPSSSGRPPAAAIGGSVGGVSAAIIVAFIIISWRKGWFTRKPQDPELGEGGGEEERGVRHVSELEGDPGKYLASVQAELPGSVPAFELPGGDLGEDAEGAGDIEHT